MNGLMSVNPPAPDRARAVVLRDFGGPGQLVIDTLPVPRRLADDEVLVRVRAGSVSPIDWKMREGLGLPQALWRRKIGSPMVPGLDFAGKADPYWLDVQSDLLGERHTTAVVPPCPRASPARPQRLPSALPLPRAVRASIRRIADASAWPVRHDGGHPLDRFGADAMPPITAILASTPLWVYAVFVLLLALGWRQTRTRIVAPGLIAAVALGMIGLSLWGVIGTFGATPVPLVAWGAGLAAGGIALAGWVTPTVLRPAGPDGRRVEVGGSALPLAVMLGIFSVKYVLGVATALHWGGLQAPAFAAGLGGLLGLASGTFAARARAIWRA